MVEMHHKSLANMWTSFLLNLKGYGEEGDELEAKGIVLKKKLFMKLKSSHFSFKKMRLVMKFYSMSPFFIEKKVPKFWSKP